MYLKTVVVLRDETREMKYFGAGENGREGGGESIIYGVRGKTEEFKINT